MAMDKFEIRKWNDQYYCKVKFPDGTASELKSNTDLTYEQWQDVVEAAWQAKQDIVVPPPGPVLPESCECPKCKEQFPCPLKV